MWDMKGKGGACHKECIPKDPEHFQDNGSRQDDQDRMNSRMKDRKLPCDTGQDDVVFAGVVSGRDNTKVNGSVKWAMKNDGRKNRLK